MRARTLPRRKGRPAENFRVSETTRLLLKAALAEDVGGGDATGNLLIPGNSISEARIIAREPGIFCGAPVLREIFQSADPGLEAVFPVPEGRSFRRGAAVLRLKGKTRSILKSERTALNFLGRLSGIATQTHAFVRAVRGYPVLILDTRKTTPLWRELEKYAVRMGGGRNHRMGLYDEIFIKENHRPYGNLSRLAGHEGEFEIEVRNQTELMQALKLRPRVILFDNFTPAGLRRAVQVARQKSPEVILEASGGITLANVAHYAAMGVDWISVGAITHSVRIPDFSLILK